MSATKPLAAAPPDISTHLDVRTEVRRIHAGVLFFYIVDAVLLGLLGAVGTVSQDLGLWYALAGCAATDLAFYWFRSQGGRADDLEALALGLTGSTGLVMLATLALAPQVGMLMLMSMMAVLALSAVWLTWQMAKASAHNITGTRLRQQVNRTNAELAQALGTLERVASTDELTMLPNRRAILAGVQRAVAAEQHGKGPVGIALLDIDRLKLINDSRGHEVGDHVLRDFGRVLALGLRPSDQVGRYGGEEFLLLLQEIDDAAAAADVVERLCADVEAYDWSRIAPGLAVTASVGVTLLMPGEDGAAAIRRRTLSGQAARQEPGGHDRSASQTSEASNRKRRRQITSTTASIHNLHQAQSEPGADWCEYRSEIKKEHRPKRPMRVTFAKAFALARSWPKQAHPRRHSHQSAPSGSKPFHPEPGPIADRPC